MRGKPYTGRESCRTHCALLLTAWGVKLNKRDTANCADLYLIQWQTASKLGGLEPHQYRK